MKVFVHGFWSGFIEETNAVNASFFIDLLKGVYNTDIELGNFEESCILLETIFSDKTYLFDKEWKHTFLYSGESRLNKWHSHYSCVLYGERNHSNIINVPLFIPNLYCSKNLLQDPVKYTSKPKNICSIISNPGGKDRNYLIDRIEEFIHIDHAGCYKNNIGMVSAYYNSQEFIEFVAGYKFIISMENSREDTYITEKILHGFRAGCIPIYWGSENITDYFNEDRFINMNSNQDIGKNIEKIKLLIEDEKEYQEMCSKPVFKDSKLELTIENISSNIRNLLFPDAFPDISKIYFICSPEFEPVRYERLNKMLKNLSMSQDKAKFICPTYKQTITEDLLTEYTSNDRVLRLRSLRMKKAELSLFLNYKAVLEDIRKNFKDGIFFIFESDVLPLDNVSEINSLLQSLKIHKTDWDIVHCGGISSDDELFGNTYTPWLQCHRDYPIYEPCIRDFLPTQLVRKFHTRCTDSFIWNYSGIVKFIDYMNKNTDYSVPFDYYMINKFEQDKTLRHYWSIISYFIQGSNCGVDVSNIQTDNN